MKRKKKNSLIIIGIIVLIIIIIIFGFIKYFNRGYNYYKIDKKNDLVYTKYKNDNSKYFVEVPFINIKGEYVNKINNEIVSYVRDYYNSNKASISYNYNINGDVLSLIIQIVDYKDKNPKIKFKSFNYNMKSNLLYNDDSLLKLFNISKDNVEVKIHNKFINYYSDEIKEGYIDSNVCKMDCFLDLRGIKDFMDNISYYIIDGCLYVYKEFNINSIIGDVEYYQDIDFKILISNQAIE